MVIRNWAVGVIVCASLMSVVEARAQSWGPTSGPDYTRNIGLLLRIGLDYGGDDIATVMVISDLGDRSTKTLKGGGLGSGSVGLIYRAETAWTLEATFGIKFDGVGEGNDHVRFWRLPVEVIGSAALGSVRLGGGPTVHLSPTFSCQIAGDCNESISLNTALGGILQLAYAGHFRGNAGYNVGLRYTHITYSADGFEDVNGSSIGGFFGFWL
jgi:hypothetical protein